MPAPAEVVDAFIAALPGEHRRLAHGEWGITVAPESAGGWPLELGLRIADGLLRAQALALTSDADPDHFLALRWNRQTRIVRFGAAGNGDVWVHGDIPVAAIDPETVDRLLGLVVEAALAARGDGAQAARSRSR